MNRSIVYTEISSLTNDSQHGKKGSYAICEQQRCRLVCSSVQSDLDILCLSTYTTISIDSVSGQHRHRFACLNVQADISLCCLQIASGFFSCFTSNAKEGIFRSSYIHAKEVDYRMCHYFGPQRYTVYYK